MRKFFVTVALVALCGPAQAMTGQEYAISFSYLKGTNLCPWLRLTPRASAMVQQAMADNGEGSTLERNGMKLAILQHELMGEFDYCEYLVREGVPR